MSVGSDLPSHRITSSTSKGYFMSPSTNPGESTKVTRLNRFCLDVQISVLKYSETPGGEFKEFLVKDKSEMQLIKIKFNWLLTFEILQRLEVRI